MFIQFVKDWLLIMNTAINLLWDYLEGSTIPSDFQDFANNLFASVPHNNIGEELTDTQTDFYNEHFSDRKLSACVWLEIEWYIDTIDAVSGK